MSGSIGEQLKQARLLQDISIEKAAQATRIRPHYLEALENDNRPALPSAVQGKGFLRLYAGYLNVDVEPLLALWDGKAPPPDMDLLVTSPPLPEDVRVETAAENQFVPAEETREDQGLDPDATAARTGAVASNAIFIEIGKKLRQQRESLGLSLAEIERYTRLRQRYIQAMETGKLDDMPSPVQARGMLSNYAAFLNLDEDKIMLRFAEGLQTRRIERLSKVPQKDPTPTKKRPAKQAPFWRRFITPDLVFGVGVAVVILLFIIWTAARIDVLRIGDAEPTMPAITDILLTADQLQPTAAGGLANSGEQPAPETEGDAVTTPNAPLTNQPVDNEEVIILPNEQTTPTDAALINTPTIAPIDNAPLQVYIVARQRAWLRITVDDKVKFLGRVIPGNAYAFSGDKAIELLTGNAAGLQVFFNQNDLGALGMTGEVKGLIFTQEGILYPTFAVLPTRTPSAEETITPSPSPTLPVTATVTPLIP